MMHTIDGAAQDGSLGDEGRHEDPSPGPRVVSARVPTATTQLGEPARLAPQVSAAPRSPASDGVQQRSYNSGHANTVQNETINLNETAREVTPRVAGRATKRPEGGWRTTRFVRITPDDCDNPLKTLSGLGQMFPNIASVVVRGQELESLHGVSSCGELWRVDAARNAVTDLEDLTPFRVLGEVNLHHNKLTFPEVAKLRDCQILQLSLFGNAQLDSYPHYRKFVITLLPHAWVLDGVFVSHLERQRAQQFFKTPAGKKTQIYEQHGNLLATTSRTSADDSHRVTHACSWRGLEVMRSFAKDPVHSKFVDKRRLRYVARCYGYELALESLEQDVTNDYELGKRSATDPLPELSEYELDLSFLTSVDITCRLEVMILLAVSLRYRIPPIIAAEVLCVVIPEEHMSKRFIQTFVRYPHFMRRALLLMLHDATERDRVSGLLRQLEIQLWSSLRVEDDSDDPEADHVLAMLGVNLLSRAPSIEQYNTELYTLLQDAQEGQAPSPEPSDGDLDDDQDPRELTGGVVSSPVHFSRPGSRTDKYSILPFIPDKNQTVKDPGAHGFHLSPAPKAARPDSIAVRPQPGQRLMVRSGVFSTILNVSPDGDILRVQMYDGAVDDSDLLFQTRFLEYDKNGYWRTKVLPLPTHAGGNRDPDGRIGLHLSNTELFSLNEGWDPNFVLAPAPLIEHVNGMFDGSSGWARISEPPQPGVLGNVHDPYSLSQPTIGPIFSNVDSVLAEQWLQDQRDALVRRWQRDQESDGGSRPQSTHTAEAPRPEPAPEQPVEDAKVFSLTTVPGQESSLPGGEQEGDPEQSGRASADGTVSGRTSATGVPRRATQSRASVRFADELGSQDGSQDLGYDNDENLTATNNTFERSRSPLPQIELNVTFPKKKGTQSSWYMVPGRPRLVVPPTSVAAHPFFEKTRPEYMNTRKFQEHGSSRSPTASGWSSAAQSVKANARTRSSNAAYQAKRRSLLSPSVTSVASIPSRAQSAQRLPLMGQRKNVLPGDTARSQQSSRASTRRSSSAADSVAYAKLDETQPSGAQSRSAQSQSSEDTQDAVLERLFEKRKIKGDANGHVEYYGKLTRTGKAPRYLWIHERDLEHIGSDVLERVQWQSKDSVIK